MQMEPPQICRYETLSLMPPAYEGQLSEADFSELLAFLLTEAGRATPRGGLGPAGRKS